MEIMSTMGTMSLGRELNFHPLVDDSKRTVQSTFESNFTSEWIVTTHFENKSPTYTLCRTGSFQIRGTKTKPDLDEAESRLRTLLSEIDVETPNYGFRHATSVFVEKFDINVCL